MLFQEHLALARVSREAHPNSSHNFISFNSISNILRYFNEKPPHNNMKCCSRSTWRLRGCNSLRTRVRLCPIFLLFLPHFRLYGVVSLHRCVLPYKYRRILEMLPKLRGCNSLRTRVRLYHTLEIKIPCNHVAM